MELNRTDLHKVGRTWSRTMELKHIMDMFNGWIGGRFTRRLRLVHLRWAWHLSIIYLCCGSRTIWWRQHRSILGKQRHRRKWLQR